MVTAGVQHVSIVNSSDVTAMGAAYDKLNALLGCVVLWVGRGGRSSRL